MTLLSGAVSLSGIVVLAIGPPDWGVAITVSVLLLLGYALDSADGQLARLPDSSSLAGEWLDHVVDAARLPSVHLALAVSLARRDDVPEWSVGVALAFMLVSSVWFFGQILAEKLSRSARELPGANAPAWVSFAKLPYDVGTLYLVLVLLPLSSVFLAAYVVLFLATLATAVPSLLRKYRALAAATPAES